MIFRNGVTEEFFHPETCLKLNFIEPTDASVIELRKKKIHSFGKFLLQFFICLSKFYSKNVMGKFLTNMCSKILPLNKKS